MIKNKEKWLGCKDLNFGMLGLKFGVLLFGDILIKLKEVLYKSFLKKLS